MKVWPDQTVGIRPRAIGTPGDLARVGVERREPAAHAKLAAAVADQDFILHDERGHRDRFATIYIAELCAPDFFAGRGIDGERLPNERVHVDAPLRERHAAVDVIAAGKPLRRRLRVRLELPL